MLSKQDKGFFDVKSLFTNISVSFTIKLIILILYIITISLQIPILCSMNLTRPK